MSADHRERIETGIIGRTLRLMLGLLFGWMLFTVLRSEPTGFGLRALAALAAITIAYLILHLAIHRYRAGVPRWLGSALVLAPFVVLFVTGGSIARLGAIGYVALSMLLQTIVADGGCILMALPALLTRRPTHLAGIVFAPIDLIERHLTGPGGLPG